jgi:hypothetical protein
VIFALENEQLPDLETKLKNDDGKAHMIQQKQLAKMKAELDELKEQELNQYELVEKKIYTEEIFLKRNKALHAEMDELKSRIYEASKTIPKEIDYGSKIVKLKDAIAAMRDEHITPLAKNKLLKTIVERIDLEVLIDETTKKASYKLHIQLLL